MKKATLFTLFSVFVLIPGALLLGRFLPGRGFYLTATLVIIFILIPFFLSFEGSRPSARKLVLIAVMSTLAVVSRAALPFLPHFKPIFGMIILAGITLGAQSGFLVGAISAFASNFFYGQGPWTPWQMLAYGICGLLAGVFYYQKNILPRDPVNLSLFGFVVVLFAVCPLLDATTIFTTLTVFTLKSVLSIFAGAILTNLLQALCTFLTLLLFSKPMLGKLERIIKKYGIFH